MTLSDADCGGTDFYDHLRMLVDVPQGGCSAPCRTGSNAEGIRGCVPKYFKKSLTEFESGRDTRMLLEKRRKGLRREIGTDGCGKSVKENEKSRRRKKEKI